MSQVNYSTNVWRAGIRQGKLAHPYTYVVPETAQPHIELI